MMGIYSITMNSTMDIFTHDQYVFVLRYISDRIDSNRLVEVVEQVVALN